MRIICIEEHALDPDIAKAAQPALQLEAIYRRHVWVTPSGMFGLPHFEFIHEVIGAGRIIWSVDYPFLTLDGTQEFLEGLPVSEDDKENMAHRNAESLFGLDVP